MQLAETLSAAGLRVFPCRLDKAPAVPKGVDWKLASQQPVGSLSWPSEMVGVPVPDGVLVVDLDLYKGVTRADAEQALGCALPWDQALIQRTQSGGEHYAFRVGWPCRNAQDLEGIKGFDLRAAGRGYVATGPGYQWVGHGVLAMAYPACLPELPEVARAAVGEIEHTTPAPALPSDHRDVTQVQAALAHIDPGCNRAEWIDIGYALRHEFHDDPATGIALWDAWSRGEYWSDGCPENYEPTIMEQQWSSLQPERPGYRPKTIATLYQRAMVGGWQPPPGVDAAAAFAGPETDTRPLYDEITAHGSDPRHMADLMHKTTTAACSPAERSALKAALLQQLKDAGLATKEVRQFLDPGTAAVSPDGAGGYGKNHTENAQTFLQTHYPDGTLVRRDGEWYAWTGKAYVEMTDEDIERQMGRAMADCLPQYDHISGARKALALYVAQPPHRIGAIAGNLVLFDNGVLDLHTGQLYSHDPSLFTTNILPYNWRPGAECGQWMAFLNDVFEGDQERIALLQEWFGYMMANDYSHHKVMVLLGPSRSGKGTIGRVLQRLVGEANYTGGSLHDLAGPKFVASLRTKPVMFIGDAEQRIGRGQVDHVIERIKKISGNDAVSIERLYKDSLSETLPTRITIAANSVPRLFDDSGALAGRLLVLPFDVSYYGREDLTLFDRIEHEMEGIAAWAVAGLQRLEQVGHFTTPAASQAEVQYIREAYSPISQFLQDACGIDDKTVTSAADAHTAYRAWALEQGEERILGRRPFISALKDVCRGRGPRYGVHRDHATGKPVRGFLGLSVGDVQTMQQEAFKPTVVPGGKR